MVFKCSISGCSNTAETTITHCLPKDPQVRKQWCEAVNRPDLIDVKGKQRYNFRVCDVHFAETAKFAVNRNRTNLKYGAVPTLHLPGSSGCATLNLNPLVNTEFETIQEGPQSVNEADQPTDEYEYVTQSTESVPILDVFTNLDPSTSRVKSITAHDGCDGLILKSAEETVTFIPFMDNDFDSVNGSTYDIDYGKNFRCAIKPGSSQVAFWETAIDVFTSMKYISPKGETVPPIEKN